MNQKPWPGYLMGEYKPLGSWKFYPVAFFLKSTISMQLLLLFSIVILVMFRLTEWRLIGVLSVIVMIFSISLVSNLNIGIRHIIHVFPFICLLIGIVFIKFLEELKGKRKLLVLSFFAVVIGHQIAVAYSSWPHMLSYFNSFAGDEPGEYIVDSDLYWGQSMYGLESYCKENNVDSLNMAVFHTNKFCAYDLPKLNFIYPYDSVKGWVAIDEYTYRQLAFWLGNEECTMNFDMFPEIPFEERYSWLRSYEPVAKVGGEGIRIYYIE